VRLKYQQLLAVTKIIMLSTKNMIGKYPYMYELITFGVKKTDNNLILEAWLILQI
jgi:hypothetical protein